MPKPTSPQPPELTKKACGCGRLFEDALALFLPILDRAKYHPDSKANILEGIRAAHLHELAHARRAGCEAQRRVNEADIKTLKQAAFFRHGLCCGATMPPCGPTVDAIASLAAAIERTPEQATTQTSATVSPIERALSEVDSFCPCNHLLHRGNICCGRGVCVLASCKYPGHAAIRRAVRVALEEAAKAADDAYKSVAGYQGSSNAGRAIRRLLPPGCGGEDEA